MYCIPRNESGDFSFFSFLKNGLAVVYLPIWAQSVNSGLFFVCYYKFSGSSLWATLFFVPFL